MREHKESKLGMFFTALFGIAIGLAVYFLTSPAQAVQPRPDQTWTRYVGDPSAGRGWRFTTNAASQVITDPAGDDLVLPWESSITITCDTVATVCFAMGASADVTITAPGVITDTYSTQVDDDGGACFYLVASSAKTKRLNKRMFPRVGGQSPYSNDSVTAEGLSHVGLNWTGYCDDSFGPCRDNADCTGSCTAYGTPSYNKTRGTYVYVISGAAGSCDIEENL